MQILRPFDRWYWRVPVRDSWKEEEEEEAGPAGDEAGRMGLCQRNSSR